MSKMPYVTVSMSKEEKEIFEQLCEKETRGPSAQFRHMLKSYLAVKTKKEVR